MQHLITSQRLHKFGTPIDLLSAGALFLFLCGWHWRVVGHLSLGAGMSLVLFLSLCIAYGHIFTRLIAPWFAELPGLPFQIILGYFLFNSLLFIIALCSPFGMAINIAIISGTAILGVVFARRSNGVNKVLISEQISSLIAIIISCIGATISCNDVQVPLIQDGNIIYRVWSDVFIHVREISVFAQSHGFSTIQDIKLAGERAPIYHFASYLSPAAISVLSGATAMQEYASLQLPLGIALTGLAAYCLMGKMFGWWPGIAATVAVVLIPDAFQQGFHVRYLSYNFMAQVNLGMLYGIASAAVAWIFMLDGCRRGKFGPILLAYGFLVICLFYKAHLFVANSYVLMMFPVLFFTPLRLSWRIGIGILATLVFCFVVSWAQSNPRVPTLRLDGSGIGHYLTQLFAVADPGWIPEQFRRLLIVEKHSAVLQAVSAAAFLLISTFGVWLFGLLVVLAKSQRTMPALFWFFPIILVINYLLTSMGLALDAHEVGSPVELLNRPLVWAYFAVAGWTAAVGYRILFGYELPKRGQAKVVAMVFLFAVGAALHSSRNLQTYAQFEAPTYASGAVPSCLVATASYLRLHSGEKDVVQDEASDPRFRLSALAERQIFVGQETFGGSSSKHIERLAKVDNLTKLHRTKEILRFFHDNKIDWFMQRPDTRLTWTETGIPEPSFTCGGFRLFHFPRAAT